MSHTRKPLRVLHIENEDRESQLVRTELRKVSPQALLRRVSEEIEFHQALRQESWDLILFSYHAGLDAAESIRHVKNHHGDLPFILLSDPVGEEQVASLMREGAEDFILRGNYQRIEAVVKRILMDRDMRMKAVKAQRRAFEAFAAREKMLAIVSHDIKNPLSAIHLEAQMLSRTVDKFGKSVMGEEVKIQAGRILKTAERMRELIVDLLEKNKGKAALKNLMKNPVDPVKLFYESLGNVRPLVQEKKIKIKFQAKEDIPEIPMDRNKIYQVFSNLLSNAIKFTPVEGEILAELSFDARNFYFSMTDSGIGLPQGEEEKVFDQYWTHNKSNVAGTGLGLFICRSIIEAHGGEIACLNSGDKGATFHFSLPREKTKSQTSAGEIFVVDDDEDLCEVMMWAIQRQGYKVKTFISGADALKALAHSRPALLIVDFHLGDMNGCEFLTERKKLTHECPVILISGSPDEVKCAAPEGEYVTIVEKPLDIEGLLREIRLLNVPCSQKSSNEASMPLSHGPASAESAYRQ